MRLKEQGKLYQQIKCSRMEVNLTDENSEVSINITLSSAIRKQYAIEFLNEAKKEFPQDLNTSWQGFHDWFRKWFGTTSIES